MEWLAPPKLVIHFSSIMKASKNSPILKLAVYVVVLSAMSASAAIRYVNVNSVNPTPPFTNWLTSATAIQDAVDAAVAGDYILVTNGIYQTGGRTVVGFETSNRVAVDKPVIVQSVNGAEMTWIEGGEAIRCAYLANGAALVGFTLTNGVAELGSGVLCESTNAVVSDCVLAGNQGKSNGNFTLGGRASGGTLNRCTLTGNSAIFGGGASGCKLNRCVLNGNSAFYGGGGASGCLLNSCVLYGNSSTGTVGGGAYNSTLNHCTLTGNSAYHGGGVYGCTGNNCIVFNNSSRGRDSNYSDSSLSYSCTTPLPPDAHSVLRLLSSASGGSGVIVSWQSVSRVNYFLERGSHLGVLTPFLVVATNIVGQAGTTTFTDTNAVGAGPFFYRVGVHE